jgi:hypothetical protein
MAGNINQIRNIQNSDLIQKYLAGKCYWMKGIAKG